MKAKRINPVLHLEGMKRLQKLPADVRGSLQRLLLDLSLEAREKAESSWRKHKAPMACYWRAVSVYAGHTARAMIKWR